MLLSNEITLTNDYRTYESLEIFQYKLTVHDRNEDSALISVILKVKSKHLDNTLFILEYETVKIPKDLTAKEWLIDIIFKNDTFIKDYKTFNLEKKEIEIVEKFEEKIKLLVKQIKIDKF